MTGDRNLVFTLSTKHFDGPFDNVVLIAKVNRYTVGVLDFLEFLYIHNDYCSTNNETSKTLGDNERYVSVNFQSDALLEVLAYVYNLHIENLL